MTLPDGGSALSYPAMPNQVSFSYFKTSPEIIQLAVMLYVRFPHAADGLARGTASTLWFFGSLEIHIANDALLKRI